MAVMSLAACALYRASSALKASSAVIVPEHSSATAIPRATSSHRKKPINNKSAGLLVLRSPKRTSCLFMNTSSFSFLDDNPLVYDDINFQDADSFSFPTRCHFYAYGVPTV